MSVCFSSPNEEKSDKNFGSWFCIVKVENKDIYFLSIDDTQIKTLEEARKIFKMRPL